MPNPLGTGPLGTGFAFPPIPNGGFRTVSGADAVAQALRSVLLTEPGERIGRPDYGAGLRRFLFEPNTLATRTAIRAAVVEAILRDEPRAYLDEVAVFASDPERVDIEVRYSVPGEPAPGSLIFPFYLSGE